MKSEKKRTWVRMIRAEEQVKINKRITSDYLGPLEDEYKRFP